MSDNPRKLGYSLSFPETSIELVSGDNIEEFTPDIFPNDPDERITIGLHLSLNEYVKLATSIDVGRDIAYADKSISIWYLWNEVLRQYAMINCADVADCIETSESVQNAITNLYQSTVIEFVNNNGGVNPNQINPNETTYPDRLPEHATEPFSPPPVGCDNDALWAGIREVVERLDGEARDLLEDVTVYNDRIEQLFEVIDLVPLLGDIIKDLSDFFTELVPDLLNGYNAFSSPSSLDNVACDIFCLVKDTCEYPTYDDLLEYFTSKSVAGLATSPQLLNYSQVWSAVSQMPSLNGSIVWHTMVSWLLFTLWFGGAWKKLWGKNTPRIWASFGEDFPNDNWEVLCDCNVYWAAEVPLYPSLPAFINKIVGGQYATFIAEGQLGGSFQIQIVINFGESANVTKYEIDYYYWSYQSPNSYFRAQTFDSDVAPIPLTGGAYDIMTFEGNETVTSQNLLGQAKTLGQPVTSLRWQKIRIYGTGQIPINLIPYQI